MMSALWTETLPPPRGRHRRAAEPVRWAAWPAWGGLRPEEPPLNADASRLVRPYVIAAEQAARRKELLLADFGVDGPGPSVIHGLEVA
ncbi:hypothetical protein [Streptomyces xanthii]|uniref:Uncharacterized protein n=1 Tax=Streptomyces xanthii TaxID=2768069 RepID=A0A7H1B7S8_9ACTN|nr:hypothetical protein [Streptomyces xanthii]QNS04783.1 hypothetical protein IAG42_14935 [Streptomyces xanthii]